MQKIRSTKFIRTLIAILVFLSLTNQGVPSPKIAHVWDAIDRESPSGEVSTIEMENSAESVAAASSAYLVKDIYPGGDSTPSNLTDIDGTLFFVATDGIHGDELWKSNGEEAGTVMVKDIKSEFGSLPAEFTNVNGTLFFRATDDENGAELWKSDGTEQGTVMVKDINPQGSSDPSGLINISGLLFFSADDGTNGRELWKSDGTSAGTEMIKDINTSVSSHSAPWYHTEMGGNLFFMAYDGVHGNELWKSNGTSSGTVRVKDINPGPDGSMDQYRFFKVVENTLYIVANDGSHGYALWKSDGTGAGTMLVKEGTGADCFYGCFTDDLGGKLYFNLGDGPSNSWDLWESNGTETGTVIVKDFTPAPLKYQTQTANNNEIFFFTVDDGIHGDELWKSDGTTQGTTLVKDIHPTASSRPWSIVNLPGGIYFSADDGTHGAELWKSDGTESGTQMVMDLRISPEGSGSAPTGLTVSGSRLFFEANEGVNGYELWALPLVSLSSLLLTGDTEGEVGQDYSFTADVSPSDATTPVTYEWQATGQTGVKNSGGLSDTVTFNWVTPGTKTISVTASNLLNSLTEEVTVTINIPAVPLSGVNLSGADQGKVGVEYSFLAQSSPQVATTPITYEWQATDQTGTTNSGGVSDTVSYTWNTTGTKTITVIASNEVNSVEAQFVISIGEADIPLGSLNLSGDLEGPIGAECEFTAEVGPLGATTPITYEWQATGQDPVINTSGLSDGVMFVWDTPGTKTVSVTARNGVNQLTKQTTIDIHEDVLNIYIPFVISP